MPERGTLSLGRRVAYLRSRKGWSQQVFADQLGKSKSWVDKIERGARRLDRFSVLQEIADVLQVDVRSLLDREPKSRSGIRGDAPTGVNQVDVAAVRDALERYPEVAWHLCGKPTPPELSEIQKAADHAWLASQHCRYAPLARGLSRLLPAAQAAHAHHSTGDQLPQSAHLLAQAYQITSSLLRKLGEPELAWLAADRAMAVSLRSGDQLLTGIATCTAGNALLALGRARPALGLAVAVANRLAPTSVATPHDRLSVHGILLLQAALAAARLGDSAAMRDLFHTAEEVATMVGPDQNHYWTSFGPANVNIHRVAAAVELGEGRQAVEIHERLVGERDFAGLVPERRARHLVDAARAYAQIGDARNAAGVLLDADRLAPSEIRCRPFTHGLITNVLRLFRGSPPAQVAELAAGLGLSVAPTGRTSGG